jgi:hypothetical protein
MTEVLILSSLQDYQLDRVQEVAERLRKDRPDLTVKVVGPAESGSLLQQSKLKFGPAVLIEGRLEFVGIPRYRMLLDRIDISIQRKIHPPAMSTATPATPTKPAGPGG